MAVTGEVHWHEGLFLQPHHLQAMQRHGAEQFAAERRLAWPYPYGLVETRLSTDELENRRVRFERLTAVMPSGLFVRVPDNADMASLDIKQAFEASTGPITVSIGVPLYYANRANACEQSTGRQDKRLFRVVEVERPDENTGEKPQPLLIRHINATLLLDNDDRSEMEVLPVMRITRATGEELGMPRVDRSFIPPCMTLGGSAILQEMLRDLANQVEASRGQLLVQLTRGGFNIETMRGIQFEQVLRLRTLNHFGPRLLHMVQVPGVAPFEAYLELRGLLGELAALHPDRDQTDVADYSHDNPAIPFRELSAKIRPLLQGAVRPSYLRVAFTRDAKMLLASLTDEHLTQPNEYFLGIRTKDEPRALAKLVEDPDRFKLMAKSLTGRAIWGIKLGEERQPPLELPAETGLHYFRLLRGESARMWDRIKDEKVMTVQWPEIDTSDFGITLFMTVPEGSENKK